MSDIGKVCPRNTHPYNSGKEEKGRKDAGSSSSFDQQFSQHDENV